MKREALNHPKMLDLSARLGISQAQAIGHVTLLINWTADFAIQGDIGKWPNGAIARGAGWDASPDTFVDALTASGWLDEHGSHRLILHDWPDHAERWVRSKLASQGVTFLAAYVDASEDTSRDTSSTVSGDPPRDQTKPNQTEPSRTKPSQTKPRKSRAKAAVTNYPEEFEEFWVAYPPGRRTDKPGALESWQAAVEVLTARIGSEAAARGCLRAKAMEYAASDQGRGGYVRLPTTWLNQQGYDDPPEAWKDKSNGNGRSGNSGGHRKSAADGWIIGPGQRYQGPDEPVRADEGADSGGPGITPEQAALPY
jgi:hypothetical protein